MTINLASDVRRPGTHHTFDRTSGAKGLLAFDRRAAFIGTIASGGTATAAVPVQIQNETDALTYAGAGSIAAQALIKALEVGRVLKNSPQIWFCGVADPGGTAAQMTITFSGTATESGDVVIKIAGRTIRIPVASGDAATAVAAECDSQIAAIEATQLPGTAGVASAVVTFTVGITGVNGNDVEIDLVETVAGISVVIDNAAVAGVGAIDTTAALAALHADHYFSVATENHTSTEVADIVADVALSWSNDKKRFRHYFMAETGNISAATTLAGAANAPELVVASFENARSLPGEIAMAIAVMRLTQEKPNYNWSGAKLPLYLPADASIYIGSEVETALAGGATPLTRDDQGNAVVERLVTTHTTNNSAPFENLRDIGNSWTPAYFALQIDPDLENARKGENQDDDLLQRYREVTIQGLRAGEDRGWFHKVDEHLDEILAVSHPSVPTRALLDVVESVVPIAAQVDATHRLLVEGA